MDISVTICLFVCNFVQLRISPARIKLAASNFAWWFISVLGRESPILRDFFPRSPKSDDSASARGTRDAPFVKYRAACGRRIGMCGYM